jgi:hypothetical protein
MKTHFSLVGFNSRKRSSSKKTFRSTHAAHSEIEAARRSSFLPDRAIENLRRDLVIDPARADEDSVEVVPMRVEKAQLRRDARNLRLRQERLDAKAGREKGRDPEGGVSEAERNADSSLGLIAQRSDPRQFLALE